MMKHFLTLMKRFLLFLVLIMPAGCNAQEHKPANPADMVNPFLGTAPLTDPEFIGYTPPDGWRVWAGLVFPEIVRASCRERVCKSVWFSVVAVSLKKKNKQIDIVTVI